MNENEYIEFEELNESSTDVINNDEIIDAEVEEVDNGHKPRYITKTVLIKVNKDDVFSTSRFDNSIFNKGFRKS